MLNIPAKAVGIREDKRRLGGERWRTCLAGRRDHPSERGSCAAHCGVSLILPSGSESSTLCIALM